MPATPALSEEEKLAALMKAALEIHAADQAEILRLEIALAQLRRDLFAVQAAAAAQARYLQ